jgi:hypothetical protein
VDGEVLKSACMHILVSTGEPVKKGRASKTCYPLPGLIPLGTPWMAPRGRQRAPSSILVLFAFSKEGVAAERK